MRTQVFPGGWYCDATPRGAYVVLMPDAHLETDRGIVPLPNGQNLLYVRMAADGIRFAGAGHQDDLIWEWDGTTWLERGPAYGVSPVIYDRDGVLRINTGSWGSQGARFVNDLNWIVTADESYFSAPMELSEWTKLAPELYIGQSHLDGTNDAAWLYDRGTTRLLEPGPCRFIRATCDGDRTAIAIWKPGQGAVVFWSTLSELRAQPIVSRTPNPDPTPPMPQPHPEDPPVSLPDPVAVLRVLERERAKYPAKFKTVAEMNAALGAVLNNTAREFPGMGMHFKTGEKAASYPGVPVTFSRDTLRVYDLTQPDDQLGYWSDVLEATGALLAKPYAPEWKRSNDDIRTFVQPVGAAPTPEPEPEPEPETEPSDIEARMARVEAWFRRAGVPL